MTYNSEVKSGEKCVLCRARSGNIRCPIMIGQVQNLKADGWWFTCSSEYPEKDVHGVLIEDTKSLLPFSKIELVLADHELAYVEDFLF